MVGGMFRSWSRSGIPVLSRGKHRWPRSGACFMEYASFLAGHRWTDSPSCTHPLLAGLARGVNDHISDRSRAGLVDLVPAVIGVVGDDDDDAAALDVVVAVRSAAAALPHASEPRQRALAVGILAAERLVSDGDLPALPDDVRDEARRALASVPDARARAETLVAGHRIDVRGFRRRSAPVMVRVAVEGLAEACIPDPDAALADLLATAIADCRTWLGQDEAASVAVPEPVSSA